MDANCARLIGKQIQAVRMNRGLTQVELAQKVGLAPKYLSNVECGNKIPKLETFVVIANALQVDANSLLSDVLVTSSAASSSVCAEIGEQLDKLPPDRQGMVLRLLSTIVAEVQSEN